MRRRRPAVVAVEMPARLRTFDLDTWSRSTDAPESREHGARSRWTAARIAWCSEHGIDFAELLRRQREQRLAGGAR